MLRRTTSVVPGLLAPASLSIGRRRAIRAEACDAGQLGNREDDVDAQVKQDAETAVAELRLFISLYDDVDLAPESRTARQLEAARHAVSAYAERGLAQSAA